jgi:hypothetical protein
MPQRRSDDAEIVYISLDSDSIDQAELALNLAPTRMAVVRGLVPYKKQVAKHMQALRIESDTQLGPDAPSYRGFNVERQVLKADGKTVVQDWTPFDPVEASRELYRLAANLDPEDEKHLDFVPDPVHKLYLPRPRLTRGTYYAPGMPELAQAIEELKQSGPPKDLTDKQKKVKGQADLFGLRPIPGTVATPQPGMPLPPPPTGPVPGYPPPGGGRGGDGIRGGPMPGRGGLIGGSAQPLKNSASPVWMLQFIDPTIEPGFAYRYRIQLKLENPNYRKESLVAYPGLAQQEEILSDWFEVPGLVVAPPDEYLYAAGERAKDRSSIGTSEYDTTNLKFHRWYDYIRVTRDNARPDPIGEWVVADLEVKRGQHARQDNKSFKVPLWSMVKGNFIFRDRISVVGGGQRLTQIAKMENVKMSFDTAVPVLVVDFEGGKGSYRVSNGTVADDCVVETLMLTGIDGQDMKLTARNAASDKLIEDRRAREEGWARWLEEVRAGGDATNAAPTGRGAP